MADYHGQSTNPEVKLLGKTNADFEPGSDTMIYLKKDKTILHQITLKCFNDIKLDLILF